MNPDQQRTLDALSRMAKKARTVKEARDVLILEAREAGIPIRLVAMYAEVSPQTVCNIVARQEEKI